MKAKWKLHKYKKSLNWRINGIKNHEHCSKENAEVLLEFHEFLFADGLSIPRVGKYLRHLCKIDKVMEKSFEEVDKKDVISFLSWLERSDYSEWTKKDYKVVLKRFFRWMNDGEDPNCTKWVKCTMKNKKSMRPQEVLSKKEVLRMIDMERNIRNRAFISTLYDSGCRIGEMMTLKIRNVSFDKYGTVLMVDGKTGVRRVRVVMSTNLLGNWLDKHPGRKDKNNYLWSHMNKPELLSYNYCRKILRKAAERAGVDKKVNPHAFRHARATHLASKLKEAQMNIHFGWVQSSKMARIYVHLSGRDVDDAILEANGIKRKEKEDDEMQPIVCSCGEINTPVNNYCNKCGKPLKTRIALEVDEKKEILKEFMKKISEKPELFQKIKEVMN